MSEYTELQLKQLKTASKALIEFIEDNNITDEVYYDNGYDEPILSDEFTKVINSVKELLD